MVQFMYEYDVHTPWNQHFGPQLLAEPCFSNAVYHSSLETLSGDCQATFNPSVNQQRSTSVVYLLVGGLGPVGFRILGITWDTFIHVSICFVPNHQLLYITFLRLTIFVVDLHEIWHVPYIFDLVKSARPRIQTVNIEPPNGILGMAPCQPHGAAQVLQEVQRFDLQSVTKPESKSSHVEHGSNKPSKCSSFPGSTRDNLPSLYC